MASHPDPHPLAGRQARIRTARYPGLVLTVEVIDWYDRFTERSWTQNVERSDSHALDYAARARSEGLSCDGEVVLTDRDTAGLELFHVSEFVIDDAAEGALTPPDAGAARDLDARPYSPDEARVARFFAETGIGGGDDPIGFILASHAELARQRNALRGLKTPLQAAAQALRSYQHGNSGPDLAEEVADACDAALVRVEDA